MELDSDWESEGHNPAQVEKAKDFAEKSESDFDESDALGYGYLTAGRSSVDKGTVFSRV